MSPNAEIKMSVLKRVWTKVVRFAGSLEGIDDPIGDYMFSLGKRVDELERDAKHLEKQQHSRVPASARALLR
jgi:hypothetical protein